MTDQNAALHVDYRYFDDDWDVASHTIDVAWQQNLAHDFRLTPFVSYYSQHEAEFFNNIADTDDRYFADDYRLSAFGAFSCGLRVQRDLWQLVGQRRRRAL